MAITTSTAAHLGDQRPHPAAAIRRTPGLLLGPYYPAAMAVAGSAGLWPENASLPPGARRLRLQGQLVNTADEPVPDALVELWQADHRGHYRHPSAPDHDQVPAGFAGHGSVRTDAQGRFVFHSLVPGAYAEGDIQRAPHLHLQITGRQDRLVTQLFLPAHPLNAADRWYRAVSHPERLTPDAAQDGDALVLSQTIVLAQG